MSKKDLDYIAALEKAIEKKYGTEAIQNPAKFWDVDKESVYLEQLKEFVQKQRKLELAVEPENVNGVLITKKLEHLYILMKIIIMLILGKRAFLLILYLQVVILQEMLLH